MKIIICTRDLDYGVGSVIKNDLRRYEDDARVKSVLVLAPKTLPGYSNKIKFMHVASPGPNFITKEIVFAVNARIAINRIIKDDKYNKIIFHFPIWAKNFGIAAEYRVHGLHKAIRSTGAKSWVTAAGNFFHLLYARFDKLTLQYSGKVIFVSRKTMNMAKEFYPEYASKFSYAANQIDKSIFYKYSSKRRQQIRSQLKIGRKQRVILYVGRLDPMKGISVLIESLDEISAKNFILVIIGSGPLVLNLTKYSFIRYMGQVEHEKIADYYNAADLFVLPSYYENMPMTVLEAKACKCQILSRDVGDVADHIPRINLFSSDEELRATLRRKLHA
jgi:glycosyltransferase involved in cell wall biosynthesis